MAAQPDVGAKLRGEERERIPELVALAKKRRKRKPYRASTASEDDVRRFVDDRLRAEGVIRTP